MALRGQQRTHAFRALRALLAHGWSVTWYVAITILFTYPVIRSPRSVIAGQVDAIENYWNLWWTAHSLLNLGQNPFHATVMHYPFGLSLYFHTYAVFHGLLSLPFQVIWGTAAAFNLLVWAILITSGLAMYALVWNQTHRRSAALVAGTIYAFCPYSMLHLQVGQTNLLAMQWLPLYVLSLLRGLEGRRRWLVGAAVVLVLSALTDWHHVVFELLITGVVGLAALLRQVSRDRLLRPARTVFGRLAVVGALFCILVSPVLIPMVRESLRDPSTQRPITDSILHSADLLAFWLPSPLHPLWGAWAQRTFYEHLIAPSIVGGITTVGYGALALAVYSLMGQWRRGALWLIILLIGGVLALGPYLQINGVNSSNGTHPVPLPYLVFRQLPFMQALRIPSRFVSLVMLALAVLAGTGSARLWERLGSRPQWQRIAVTLGLLLVVLFEYWPQATPVTAITPDHVSSFYQQLGKDGAEFALLDVPYLEHPSLFFQTYHHKPTMGGRIARPKLHPWFAARFFGPLIQGTTPWQDIGADDGPAAWRAALRCQGVRYVVFYQQDLTPERQAEVQTLEQRVFGDQEPSYTDDEVRAYGPLLDVAREAYWTVVDQDWYSTEVNELGLRYRWMKGDHGRLLIYPCGPREVTLRFNAYGFAQPRTLSIRLNGAPVADVSLPQEQVTPVEVPLILQPGENRIDFQSLEPPTSPNARGFANDDRMLTINISNVRVR